MAAPLSFNNCNSFVSLDNLLSRARYFSKDRIVLSNGETTTLEAITRKFDEITGDRDINPYTEPGYEGIAKSISSYKLRAEEEEIHPVAKNVLQSGPEIMQAPGGPMIMEPMRDPFLNPGGEREFGELKKLAATLSEQQQKACDSIVGHMIQSISVGENVKNAGRLIDSSALKQLQALDPNQFNNAVAYLKAKLDADKGKKNVAIQTDEFLTAIFSRPEAWPANPQLQFSPDLQSALLQARAQALSKTNNQDEQQWKTLLVTAKARLGENSEAYRKIVALQEATLKKGEPAAESRGFLGGIFNWFGKG